MENSLKRLLRHRRTHFSQSGEDGVLDHILSKLPVKNGWCVEFGAWDGRHLSNTHYFISRHGYRAVLIEGDAGRAADLASDMATFPGCHCVNAFVRPDGPDRLDRILARTPLPESFDLLSIDIDGDDYHVWQSLEGYTPAVVIVEINIRDKPGVRRIHTPGAPPVWGVAGTSIRSMTELARSKGYALVANVGCNAIYVREDCRPLFHDRDLRPEEVFLFEGHKLYEMTWKEVQPLGTAKALTWMVKKLYQKVAFWRTDWEKNQ